MNCSKKGPMPVFIVLLLVLEAKVLISMRAIYIQC